MTESRNMLNENSTCEDPDSRGGNRSSTWALAHETVTAAIKARRARREGAREGIVLSDSARVGERKTTALAQQEQIASSY